MSELWRMEGGGTLSLREEGPRVYLEAARPDDGRGLYKAWVRGREGSFLLGTLLPEAGGLRLKRTVSRSSLERAGCWPVTGGSCVLFYPFPGPGGPGEAWTPEPIPDRLCGDPLVKESLRGRSGFCARRDGARYLLSAPFRPDRPFPIPILFCLASVEIRGGRPWLVWTFDGAGTPILPRIEPPEGGHTEGAERNA